MTRNLVHTLLIAAALTLTASAQTIQVNHANRTIAVTVTDKATAPAEVATVHIGFEAYEPDSDSAYAAGSRTSNAIMDALHKAGIADKDIESEAQNLRRNDQFDEKESAAERARRRFVLSQSWTVHTSAADAAKVLHIAVQAGANSSGQIDWDVKDHAALQARAAAKALKHAQTIADQMAKGLNAHLGSLLYASNREPETPVRPMMYERMGLAAKLQEVKPLAINPQKIEQSATVYAVFAIE